jgi:ribose transport system substrate-binding protein
MMKKMRFIVFAVLLTLSFGLLAACGDTTSEKTSGDDKSTEKADKDIKIVLVPKVAVPFFDDCNTGGKEAATELGIKYEWVVPQNTQGSTQVKIIEDLISKHVDGIGISINEAKSVEKVIQQAIDAGIKVVTYDSDSPNSGRTMYIGTINEAAGATMGETMAEAIGGKGEVAIVTGQLGAQNLNDRITGIKKALAKYPDIKIIDTQGTEDDLAKAVSVTEGIFRAHPNVKGIFGVSQVGGPGVAKTLQEKEFSHLKGVVKVFAFDDLKDTIKGVEDGYIDGIMVQRPITMGKLAVEHLYAQIKGTESVPQSDIDTGVTIVTKENLGSYTK